MLERKTVIQIKIIVDLAKKKESPFLKKTKKSFQMDVDAKNVLNPKIEINLELSFELDLVNRL
jgi:hypothetical protein